MQNSTSKKKIAVLGAGSWGTALACLLADNNHEVTLWSHSSSHLEDIQKEKTNHKYLPDFKLPDSLQFSSSLSLVCDTHRIFLIVVPSHAFSSLLDEMKKYGVAGDSVLIWGTKGFDTENKQLLSQLIEKKFSSTPSKGVISGPSFAYEVMQKLPTALTASSDVYETAKFISNLFHNDYVRVYANTDLAGVQIGGAVKNVLAIACGISDGLGFGANARAALITRGLREIIRLGERFGAKPETFQGLSGIGDLVLTCTDNKSRNRRFGLGIGQGMSTTEVLNEIGQEVEGVFTSKEVKVIADMLEIELPICEQVYQIIHNNIAPKQAVATLLKRAAAFE